MENQFDETDSLSTMSTEEYEEIKRRDNAPIRGFHSVVLGIVAMCLSFCGIMGIVFGIMAIVTGASARKYNRNDNKAIVGIILGIIALASTVLLAALVLFMYFNRLNINEIPVYHV